MRINYGIALVPIVIAASAAGILHYRTQSHRLLLPHDSGGKYTFCFPAAQMRGRVMAYRKQFVENYLLPQKPYGMFEAMTQARMEPLSLDDEKKIGARGPFIFTSPGTLTNDASHLGICSSGPICSSASFPVDLGGGNYTVGVDIPPTISVSVTNNSALVFDLGAGIPIHIANPGATPLPVLRSQMYIQNVSLSDSMLQETVSSPASATDGSLTVTIQLDLTGSCDASQQVKVKEAVR